VEHGLSAGLAQILAGSLSKKEKPAQVIDIKNDIEMISKAKSKDNNYCATYEPVPKPEPAKLEKLSLPSAPKRTRHVPMRRRVPRKIRVGDTTTPPPPSPTP
jgi:hypothetical protein